MNSSIVVISRLCELLANGESAALAVLITASGSSPQHAGSKMLIQPNGKLTGTVGGGCLEAEIRRVGLEALRSGANQRVEVKLDGDMGWDDGLICGGSVTAIVMPVSEKDLPTYRALMMAVEERLVVTYELRISVDKQPEVIPSLAFENSFGHESDEIRELVAKSIDTTRPASMTCPDGSVFYCEPIKPRPVILIYGAGHVGANVSQIASLCGFEVVVVDDRPAFANVERLPWVDRVNVAEIPEFAASYAYHRDCYVVIVTRGHRHDMQTLAAVVKSPARYIGMIGSKRKVTVIYEGLLEEGLATPEELLAVHSPMGLSLGDREVGEIAVSIMAEITAVRNGVDTSAIRPMSFVPPFLRDGSDRS